jgi:hypothetical protein
MSSQGAPHARRSGIVAPEPLIGGARYDYADSFEIQLPESDTRSPEQLFRTSVKQASSALRWAVPIVHRRILLFRLGPLSSPDHLLGWHIVTSEPELMQLEAAGPLMRGVIVVRRVGQTGATFTTFVFNVRRAPARIVWAIIAPLHRRVAPYLLKQVVAAVEPG